jgi:hypothetical protein
MSFLSNLLASNPMDSAAVTAIKDSNSLVAVKLAAAYFLVQNM